VIFNVCFFFLPIGSLLREAFENLLGMCSWICVWNSLFDWGTLQIIVCVRYRDEVGIQKSC
jgi:hypothetical protein